MLKYRVRILHTCLISIFALMLSNCATKEKLPPTPLHPPKAPQTLKQHDRADHSPRDLIERIRLGYQLPSYVDQPKVQRHITRIKKHPSYLSVMQTRSAPYLYYIVSELEKAQLPLEIAFLPMVESAFDAFAYSHGQASGLWQFIPSTGKRYGLQQTWWYDGRRDLIASTQAAIQFLKQLNSMFDGQWLLALAAYNSGPARVMKAIKTNRKAGVSTDFWSLELPKETREYVPKLLAIAEIVKNPKSHGFLLSPLPNQPYFQQVTLNKQIDLAKAAQLADTPLSKIYQLNPAFNQWATSPDGPHSLLVPIEKVALFKNTLAKLQPKDWIKWERYIIQPNDNLGSIAALHNTHIKVIKSVNNLHSNRIIAGEALIIPTASHPSSAYSLSKPQRLIALQNKSIKGRKKSLYNVKPGDSFWSIAKEQGISVNKLTSWNRLSPKDRIFPGQSLIIWHSKPIKNTNTVIKKVFYKVRNGDSLARIASKFKVQVAELKTWNQLQGHKYIHPGQKLVLYVNVTQLNS